MTSLQIDDSKSCLSITDIKHKITKNNIQKYNVDISKFSNLLDLRRHIQSIQQKLYDNDPVNKEKRKEYNLKYAKERYKEDEEYRIKRNIISSRCQKTQRSQQNGGTPRPRGRPRKHPNPLENNIKNDEL